MCGVFVFLKIFVCGACSCSSELLSAVAGRSTGPSNYNFQVSQAMAKFIFAANVLFVVISLDEEVWGLGQSRDYRQ